MVKTKKIIIYFSLFLLLFLYGCEYKIISHSSSDIIYSDENLILNFTVADNSSDSEFTSGLMILRMPSNWYVVNYTQATNSIPEENYLSEFFLRNTSYVNGLGYLWAFEDNRSNIDPDPHTVICPTNDPDYKIFYYSQSNTNDYISAGGIINYSLTISTNNSDAGDYVFSYIIGDSEGNALDPIGTYYTDWICNDTVTLLAGSRPVAVNGSWSADYDEGDVARAGIDAVVKFILTIGALISIIIFANVGVWAYNKIMKR